MPGNACQASPITMRRKLRVRWLRGLPINSSGRPSSMMRPFLHEQDTVGGLARKLHLVRHHRQGHAVGGSQTSTRTGVGLKPLQGLLTCGQLEITKITSMSAVTSTWLPPAEMPSTTVKFPEGSIGTFMKKFRLATMSRLARPYLESSMMKFSRHACWAFVHSPTPTTSLSHAHHPPQL